QRSGKDAYKVDKKLVFYLQDHIGKAYKIIYPKMPNEDKPDYESWKAMFDKELGKIEGKIILIGHSVGGFLLLKYLSEKKVNKNVAGIFFISIPFLGEKGWQHESMTLDNEFTSKLPPSPIFVYHSTNDKMVPFSQFL